MFDIFKKNVKIALSLISLICLVGCNNVNDKLLLKNSTYNEIRTLKAEPGEGFFALICSDGEKQCEILQEGINKYKNSIKKDLYYYDIGPLVTAINEPEITNEVLNSRINELQNNVHSLGATTSSSIMYIDSTGEYEYVCSLDENYYNVINNGEDGKIYIDKILKELKAFLNDPVNLSTKKNVYGQETESLNTQEPIPENRSCTKGHC